ncbi:hypothetical protein K1T71_002220 [Dendrolimus kikuchii]|uniref:Uncharacterized protein n=1 Tax=Dendrolimus kikuchii TaxID=765133 RepID=A0ACC1DHJ7_9NEOP|nr:hypothetical protein K1T71_002220 [Dendrolimus kikuchii]
MEQLLGLNTLHVRQKHTVFVGNKYVVCSPSGEVLFYAKEDAGFFSVARGKNRPFYIDIYDTQNKLVIGLRRPYTFGPDKMDVTVNGSLASVVRQELTLMKPVLNINDANDRHVLRVKGPAMALQGNADYEIFTSNKTRIGCIEKQWSGFMREAFTDADNFRLTFPKDLDVRFKAAIIGTSFLIVVGLRRPFNVGRDKMDVTVNGSLASVVRQERTWMKPVPSINDANNGHVLRVKGPIMLAFQGGADFEIFSTNKTRIGCIQKQWSGFWRETFTDADNFQLTFPEDLDVRFKAAIIGTSFLIVMGLRRPHTFGPTKMDVKVYGTLVSVVRVVPTLITPVMNIYDAFNQRLLRVKGPMSWQGCGNFDIFTNNKTRIGCIQKRWGGFLKEAFTEADNFVITFPRVLDVRIKAAILGTCFLIVMSLRRPYTFGPDKMDVKINGSLVSVVRVEPTFMKPVLNINDADDKRVLRVKGPMCQDGEVDYETATLFEAPQKPEQADFWRAWERKTAVWKLHTADPRVKPEHPEVSILKPRQLLWKRLHGLRHGICPVLWQNFKQATRHAKLVGRKKNSNRMMNFGFVHRSVENTSAMSDDEEPAAGGGEAGERALTAAQRARIERNRLRARALHDARLVRRPQAAEAASAPAPLPDTGGGFIPEEEEAGEARAPAPRPAPIVHAAEQPRCEECARPFPQSYLFDAFGHPACDGCRDDADRHALITRTEAKGEYLLKDCDLDSRPPPLRCVRRRNPHSARYGDMRLYLRAQVEARALQVWGSEARLEEERARRSEGAARLKHARTQKRLRALRMDVRSSLYDRSHRSHEHEFGPERRERERDRDDDTYSRECTTCGFRETYEKM